MLVLYINAVRLHVPVDHVNKYIVLHGGTDVVYNTQRTVACQCQ